MKIAHIITGLEADGAETMLYKLLGRMDRRRFEPLVVSLMDRGPLAARIEDLGIPVFACGMPPGRPAPRAALRLLKKLRGFRPDLLQGWMYHGNLAAQFAASVLPGRTPVIWNIRGAHCALREEKPLTAAAIWLSARLSRLPAAVVNNSKASADLHERLLGFRARRRAVIPNGFEIERFQPSEAARAAIRARLRLPQDCLIVGMIGRYHPVKDHSNFLRAAAILRKQVPHAQFVLAGAGVDPANAPLNREAKSLELLDCVHLLGALPDIQNVTAALDIATSASSSEGFPNVIGEAMSCAVPCVVTDVGDSSWLVGETGLTVPPRSSEALAKAWGDLIARGAARRRALGDAARHRIARHFSISSIAAQYEHLYERTLNTPERTHRSHDAN